MTVACTRKLKPGSWVRVHWDDASSHDEGWATSDKLENGIQKCISSGIVAKKDRKQVILAMSYGKHASDNEEQYATTMAIPLGWITHVDVWP